VSDPHTPCEVFIRKLPSKRGNFLTEIKLEVFASYSWRHRYLGSPSQRKKCAFDLDGVILNRQRVPPEGEGFYRLRVNGKWYRENGCDFSFFTGEKIAEILF
jgi:hypothetical protein